MIMNDVLHLAAHQASWLLARENLVAQNIANANTPGYKAADLKPFEAALQSASLQLTTTSPGHFNTGANEIEQPAPEDASTAPNETFLSGNDVSLEREMLKGGEINRSYALNVAVTKAFNGMILQAAKG